jgi:uncharacterized protein DUF3467
LTPSGVRRAGNAGPLLTVVSRGTVDQQMSTESTGKPIIPQIYANLSQCSASPSDISITLALSGTAPFGGGDNSPPTHVAVVRLGPSAAKMLLLNLQQMVSLYEARFAKIYVPKEFEDAIRETAAALGITSEAAGKGAS